MNKNQPDLNFIALVPPEPVNGEVMSFKEEVRERFGSKAALRSPPHITLHMPFQWKEEKESKLIESLNQVAKTSESFEVRLKNFGAFPPRVIYIDVQKNEKLNQLQSAVQKTAKMEWHIYPKSNSRPFQPHMTIAFRDLKKPQFYEAWNEFENRSYLSQFNNQDLCLLKHNGKNWDILQRIALK